MPLVKQERAPLSSGPEATVIIPVRNGERTLRRCLDAVFATRDIGEFEVIVVDDGSTDSTATITLDFSCRLIHSERSRGPAAARNRGAREARAARLLFVDADVFVKPDTLALLLRALNGSPAAFATYEAEPLNRNFATLLYHTLSCLSLKDTSERTPVFYSYCAAIGKDRFLKMGGFDPSFTRATFEDMELGWRLAGQGLLSHHLKSIKVDHAVKYNLSGLARAYYCKSQDLTLLLLSRRSVTLGDEGWTHRKNWAALVCAWAILGLGPLSVWVNPLWAVPWTLAVCGFIAASAPVYQAMARRRWVYGPLSLAAYLGIHCIATSAMLSGALKFLTNLFRSPSLPRCQVRQPDENLAGGIDGGRSL